MKKIFKGQSPLGFLGFRQASAENQEPPRYLSGYKPVKRMHKAASVGDITQVQRMLIFGDVDVNITDRKRRTALHYASAHGQPEMVSLLLWYECSIDVCDLNKSTALIKATQRQHEKCVQILLEYGADVNVFDADQNTALHYAVYNNNMTIAAELLAHNANTEVKAKNGYTPLILAVQENNQEMAELLLKKEANINALDHCNRSALIHAVRAQSKNMISFLLQQGADDSLVDVFGATAKSYSVFETFQVLSNSLGPNCPEFTTKVDGHNFDPKDVCTPCSCPIKENKQQMAELSVKEKAKAHTVVKLSSQVILEQSDKEPEVCEDSNTGADKCTEHYSKKRLSDKAGPSDTEPTMKEEHSFNTKPSVSRSFTRGESSLWAGYPADWPEPIKFSRQPAVYNPVEWMEDMDSLPAPLGENKQQVSGKEEEEEQRLHTLGKRRVSEEFDASDPDLTTKKERCIFNAKVKYKLENCILIPRESQHQAKQMNPAFSQLQRRVREPERSKSSGEEDSFSQSEFPGRRVLGGRLAELEDLERQESGQLVLNKLSRKAGEVCEDVRENACPEDEQQVKSATGKPSLTRMSAHLTCNRLVPAGALYAAFQTVPRQEEADLENAFPSPSSSWVEKYSGQSATTIPLMESKLDSESSISHMEEPLNKNEEKSSNVTENKKITPTVFMDENQEGHEFKSQMRKSMKPESTAWQFDIGHTLKSSESEEQKLPDSKEMSHVSYKDTYKKTKPTWTWPDDCSGQSYEIGKLSLENVRFPLNSKGIPTASQNEESLQDKPVSDELHILEEEILAWEKSLQDESISENLPNKCERISSDSEDQREKSIVKDNLEEELDLEVMSQMEQSLESENNQSQDKVILTTCTETQEASADLTMQIYPLSEKETMQRHPPSGKKAMQLHLPSGKETVQLRPPSGKKIMQLHPPSEKETMQLHPPSGKETMQLHPPSGKKIMELHPPSEKETMQLHPSPLHLEGLSEEIEVSRNYDGGHAPAHPERPPMKQHEEELPGEGVAESAHWKELSSKLWQTADDVFGNVCPEEEPLLCNSTGRIHFMVEEMNRNYQRPERETSENLHNEAAVYSDDEFILKRNSGTMDKSSPSEKKDKHAKVWGRVVFEDQPTCTRSVPDFCVKEAKKSDPEEQTSRDIVTAPVPELSTSETTGVLVKDGRHLSKVDQSDRRPTKKQFKKKPKIKTQVNEVEEVDDISQSSMETASDRDSGSLLKLWDMVHSYERLIELKNSHYELLMRKIEKMENKASGPRELSEVKRIKSCLQHEAQREEGRTLRFPLKQEDKRQEHDGFMFRKQKTQLRRKKEQYNEDAGRNQQPEIRSLLLDAKAIENYLKQVFEKQNSPDATFSRTKCLSLTRQDWGNHLCKQTLLQGAQDSHTQAAQSSEKMQTTLQRLEVQLSQLKIALKEQSAQIAQIENKLSHESWAGDEMLQIKKLTEVTQSLECSLEKQMNKDEELEEELTGFKKLFEETKKKLTEHENRGLSFHGDLNTNEFQVHIPINMLRHEFHNLKEKWEATYYKYIHMIVKIQFIEQELISIKTEQKKYEGLLRNQKDLEEEVQSLKNYIQENTTQAGDQNNRENLRDNKTTTMISQMESRIESMESQLSKMMTQQNPEGREVVKSKRICDRRDTDSLGSDSSK